MNEADAASEILGVAVIFARVGGVFLIAPGLSSVRIPVRIRLFIALAIALTVTPLLLPVAVDALASGTPADMLRVLGLETVTGFFIGLMLRLIFMALQTMSVATANLIGLGVVPGISMNGNEPAQAVSNLFTLTAVTIIFLTDLHHEMLRGLVQSYEVLPPGIAVTPASALTAVADRASEAFFTALRLIAPFVIYSVIVNFAVGLTNKMTPQLPIFFVALPFVTAAGLFLLALAIREVLFAFTDAFYLITQSL